MKFRRKHFRLFFTKRYRWYRIDSTGHSYLVRTGRFFHVLGFAGWLP